MKMISPGKHASAEGATASRCDPAVSQWQGLSGMLLEEVTLTATLHWMRTSLLLWHWHTAVHSKLGAGSPPQAEFPEVSD